MFSYNILNQPLHFKLDESKINKIFYLISHHIEIIQKGILNIAFLSDEEIKNLNREHRNIDKTTDVLSFHYFEDFSALKDEDIAGELIFSESKILSQSKEYGHNNADEFYVLLVHSILHILGYDHEEDEDFEVMWKYEKDLRMQLGLPA